MDPQRAASALDQHRQVAAGLRSLNHAKAIAAAGNADILRIMAGDLQENAGIRSALVGLAGRMLESRSEAETGRRAGRVANHRTHRGQAARMAVVSFDISEQRDIIARRAACVDAAEMAPEIADRVVVPPEFARVARVRIEREAVFAEYRRFRWQALRFGIDFHHCARLQLARFDVRLIERIDRQDRAGDGDGDLPAEKLPAKAPHVLDANARNRMSRAFERRDGVDLRGVRLPLQLDVDEKAVGAVTFGRRQRFARDGDQAAPQFSGTLRQQLFEPGAERRESLRGDDCHLIALKAGRRNAQRDAELHARVFVWRCVGAAGALHLPCGCKQALDVNADRRRGHETKV